MELGSRIAVKSARTGRIPYIFDGGQRASAGNVTTRASAAKPSATKGQMQIARENGPEVHIFYHCFHHKHVHSDGRRDQSLSGHNDDDGAKSDQVSTEGFLTLHLQDFLRFGQVQQGLSNDLRCDEVVARP